ncbi:MAG: lipoprotein, partial [Nitrospirota bacterium]
MRRSLLLVALVALALLSGCTDTSRSRGVYMLVDTSGTYTEELQKAEAIVNYLLGTLEPGDSLAVARIDSGSFSEKDIVAKVTF